MEKKIKQLLKVIKLNEDSLSMIFGVITVLLVGILAFRMYKTKPPEITEKAETTISSPMPTATIGDVAVVTKDDGSVVPAELPETYAVSKGDHLWKIAQKFYGSGYNWVDIAKENNLTSPGQLEAGQELKLPKVAVIMTTSQKAEFESKIAQNVKPIEGDSYVVEKGDNLWNISVRAYADGYKWPEVAKANEIKSANYIEVGQKLVLPR
ncbi:MAG: LysM peptidoglycan-binding domain-containing protein [bacterium]